ncbi:MAG: acyltransferase [Planctomycetota bacterium]|nr:acyltransferase [Planctomycetota bacterium]
MGKTRSLRLDLNAPRVLAIFGIILFHVTQYFKTHEFPGHQADSTDILGEIISKPALVIFVLLAGIAHAFGTPRLATLQAYLPYVRTKLRQIMLPYLCVSLLSMGVKLAAPGGRDSGAVGDWLLNMLWVPNGGPAGHLWFLYWLMTIFLFWPLLAPLTTPGRLPFLAGGLFLLAVQPIPLPATHAGSCFGLANLQRLLPVFVLGVWYGSTMLTRQKRYARVVIVSGSVFAAWLAAYFTWFAFFKEGNQSDQYAPALLFKTGHAVGELSGAIFLLHLSGLAGGLLRRGRKFLGFLACHSFDTYLLHVAFVAHPLVLALSFLARRLELRPGAGAEYVLFFVVAILVSLITPALGAWIRRAPVLPVLLFGEAPRKRTPAPSGG